jgi:hypothetical protein
MLRERERQSTRSACGYAMFVTALILCKCRACCHCYCDGVCAQDDPSTATISDLFCVSVWFVIIPNLPTRALWQLTSDPSTGYCCWVVSNESSQALPPFSDLLCVPVWVLIHVIHPSVFSGCTRDIYQWLRMCSDVRVNFNIRDKWK